jgi:hypothetical protein
MNYSGTDCLLELSDGFILKAFPRMYQSEVHFWNRLDSRYEFSEIALYVANRGQSNPQN